MGNVDTTLGHLDVDRDKSEVYEDWMMAQGELDGTQVTVFSAAHPSSSRKRPYIERALQASRVYRHPGLLRYLDGGMVGGEVVVVTERATPLRHHGLDTFSPLHISAGLQSIIETLVFLHDRAGVSHNNVSASSIFITPDGAWKLWGLEYSCSFGKLTRDHVEHINSYCHERAVPPDDKARISPSYQHARDSYAFGHLVEDVLTPEALAEVAGAADFLALVRKSCLAAAPNQRPRLAELAYHAIFSHAFLKLHDTLTNILLLTDQKREEFLTSVAESLEQYPEELVSSTLAGALLSRPVLLHPAAASHLMPRVLTPHNGPKRKKTDSDGGGGDDSGGGGGGGAGPGGGGGGGRGRPGLFSEEVFCRDIVPQVVRLFGVHDATVRGILLAHLPSYVSLVPRDVLAEDVLPELLLGIRDSSDALVSATLHALAHLVPILGASVVVGENRHNLFTTAKPKAAAILPLTKGVSSSLAKEPLVNGIKVTKPHPTPSASPRSPEPTPPPPPPRSISLAGAEATSDAASLDNLSLDSLTLTHIPERSSPDGGEDSTNPAAPSLASPGLAGGDMEAWSSDWEDMQEGTSEVFNGEVALPPKDVHSGWGVSLGGAGGDDVFSQTLQPTVTSPNDASPPSQHGKTKGARQSSGMKLVRSGKTETPPAPPRRPPSLGEEFDVLAIKVNKKRDAELDLFADLAPSFTTKKFDLETMLVEANCRAKGVPLARTPSVSETLAGLDTKMGEDAWGDEGGWDDPLDLPVSPSPPSVSRSPAKLNANWESEPWPDLTGPDLPSETNGIARDVTPSVPQRPVKDGWDDSWGDDF